MSGGSVRVFLDADTLVSGLLFRGNESVLLELGRVGAVDLVANFYVLEEVTRVLKREEFSISSGEVQEVVKYVHVCVTVLEDPSSKDVGDNFSLLDDKKDIPVALMYRESDADFLVTVDRELLYKVKGSTTTKKLLKRILGGKTNETC